PLGMARRVGHTIDRDEDRPWISARSRVRSREEVSHPLALGQAGVIVAADAVFVAGQKAVRLPLPGRCRLHVSQEKSHGDAVGCALAVLIPVTDAGRRLTDA